MNEGECRDEKGQINLHHLLNGRIWYDVSMNKILNAEMTISYFQTRSLPLNKSLQADLAERDPLPTSLSKLKILGFESVDLGNLYDEAERDTAHFRRFESRTALSMKSSDCQNCLPIHKNALVTLLISSTGYYVIGITVRSDLALDSLENEYFTNLIAPAYSDSTLRGDWIFEFPGMSESIAVDDCNVRILFEIIGFAIHEILMGRKIGITSGKWFKKMLERIPLSIADAIEHRLSLLHKKELSTNNVVTWGYHTNIIFPSSDRSSYNHFLDQFENGIFSKNFDQTKKFAILTAGENEKWMTARLESINVVISTADIKIDNHLNLAYSSKFIEYLAYRRGVLAIIQRDTQRAMSERQDILSKQVSHWIWLLSSVTDDFVLGGNIDMLLMCNSGARGGIDHFDLILIEKQTRRNVESLAQQLNAKQGRYAMYLSVLFGVVALVSLIELFERLLPFSFIIITISLLFLVAILSGILTKRSGRLKIF